MQGCFVGGRIGVRSRQCMRRWRSARSQTETVLPRAARTCRGREPMIEGGSPPPISVVSYERGHGGLGFRV